ncbi:MAG: cytochrome b/b6 domain-containing protein [Proteobacteria bacterium]|nr:cytochrome b/b6 domain-containing protein [Pseudomonadota bacterium]
MSNSSNHEYFRFNLIHRLLHGAIIISFLGLAITGMPLKYSGSDWSYRLVRWVGGFEAAAFLHRVCAVITFGYFIGHLIYLAYFFAVINKEPFGKFIFGPNSMVPNLKDLRDIRDMFKWFFGLGPKPKFDRFTYWEKFDYWAVFWGMFMIGGSGLMLWFPTFFSKYVPGWLFNVATIIHSDEALLASGFIFIFHYIHTHIRGEKFPLDYVIFTGRLTEEELKEERPLEYQRLLEKGEIEEIKTNPTPRWLRNFSAIVGLSALIVGIIIVILIGITEYHHIKHVLLANH